MFQILPAKNVKATWQLGIELLGFSFMRLIVENIRSFAGRHTVDLKPLTILVGENSSGKSTLLAALAALSDKQLFQANWLSTKSLMTLEHIAPSQLSKVENSAGQKHFQ